MAIITPFNSIILCYQKFSYHNIGITNYTSESVSHNFVKSSTFAISASILE